MADFDPKNRELCPDGTCIGLIGPDGRCRECGTVSPTAVSDPRNQGLDLQADEDQEVPEALANRELCADGACTGIVGQDGRCGECGRTPAEIRAEEGEDEDGGDEDFEDGDEDFEDGDEDLEDGDQDLEDGDEDLEDGDEASLGDKDGDEGGDDDWGKRTLCPDDTCIGVLRADGTCPECGGQAPASNQPS